jgi:DNA-3-methyladenine glycosylase II
MNAYEHLSQDPVMAGLIARHGKIRNKPSHEEPMWRCARRSSTSSFTPRPQQPSSAASSRKSAADADSRSRNKSRTPATKRCARGGLSRNKAAALRDVAAHALDGRLPTLDACKALNDDALVERLTDIRGIGRWTVEMLLIFDLGRPDVLPVDDLGVRRGFQLAYHKRQMPTPKALAEFGRRWAPRRTLAALYLWRAADANA